MNFIKLIMYTRTQITALREVCRSALNLVNFLRSKHVPFLSLRQNDVLEMYTSCYTLCDM